MYVRFVPPLVAVFGFLGYGAQVVQAAPSLLNTNLQIRLIMNTTNSTGVNSVRIAKDPRNDQLYYLKLNGDIYRLNLTPGTGSTSTRAYGAADHGLSDDVQGMAIGPDGTIYLVANTKTNQDASTFARIMKGVPNAAGVRAWSLVAQTEPYPRGVYFNHIFNGIVVSPDGKFLYLNSGARTDHGEVSTYNGVYPNLRETDITTKILRVPTSGSNLVLSNNITALRGAGYIFAEGNRNAFDLAFAANGDLFATDNGPDRSMSDSLYWLRPGLHYGFPWRMGGANNPQQFPNYDPATDPLLDPRFIAVKLGYYHNDPTFPPPPTNFADPVISVGPDADSFLDPVTGAVKDASNLGQTIKTFTAHRSPLGLIFDTVGTLAPPFQQHGFMLSWTPGDPNGTNVAGPFKDPSQDMLDLDLTKLGTTNYQARVTRIVGGFSNPIDSEIISNKIYVVEYGGNQGIWEITFPPAAPRITLSQPAWVGNGSFGFNVNGANGHSIQIETSTNLTSWLSIANLVATNNTFQFVDPKATNSSQRFYRVTVP